jgi:hypothetical protein
MSSSCSLQSRARLVRSLPAVAAKYRATNALAERKRFLSMEHLLVHLLPPWGAKLVRPSGVHERKVRVRQIVPTGSLIPIPANSNKRPSQRQIQVRMLERVQARELVWDLPSRVYIHVCSASARTHRGGRVYLYECTYMCAVEVREHTEQVASSFTGVHASVQWKFESTPRTGRRQARLQAS